MIKNLESIKEKIDIVEVITSFLPLKQVGGNFNACCPFHNEKSPSFVVSPSKQIFHCFGCGKGGDVFKFVSELKGISFLESVELCVSIAHLHIEFENNQKSTQNKDYFKRATELNEVLQEMYLQTLLRNEKVLAYLYKRGLQKEDFTKYELGLSPSGKEIELKLSVEQLKIAYDLGILAKSKMGETYSPLAHRITFALRNTNYKIVGFSGRAHPYYNFRNSPKYINSRESHLFKKSNILYRLSHIKNVLAKAQSVYVVEGFMDAIALDKMGISNAVATAGTAFSVSHLSLLNKFKDLKIILAFDKDSAGGEAILRALHLCFKNQIFNVFVCWNLNNAKDFGEVLQNGEKLELKEMNGYRFFLKYHYKKAHNNQEKERILNLARENIAHCTLYYERQTLIETTSEVLRIPKELLFANQKAQQKQPTPQTLETSVLKNALHNKDFAYILKESIQEQDCGVFNDLANVYIDFLYNKQTPELNALMIDDDFIQCSDDCAFSDLIRALMIAHKQKELAQAKISKNIPLIIALRKELDFLAIPF